MQDGQTFEKAGVNVSVVHGNIPQAAVSPISVQVLGNELKVLIYYFEFDNTYSLLFKLLDNIFAHFWNDIEDSCDKTSY